MTEPEPDQGFDLDVPPGVDVPGVDVPDGPGVDVPGGDGPGHLDDHPDGERLSGADPEGQLGAGAVGPGGLYPGLPGYPDDGPLAAGVDPAQLVVDPDAPTVHGSPDTDAEYWLYQGDGLGTCAPTSVAMVLSDVLGVPIGSNEEVVARALELGLMEYDPEKYPDSGGYSGMTDQGILLLVESYGVDVNQRHGDLDDLTAHLDAGYPIMVAVDADEVWAPGSDDQQDSGVDANHELVVTGIDEAAGVVFLNDSGTPDGQGSVIPLEQFLGAWADSGNSMIVTDLPGEEAGELLVAGYADAGAADGGLLSTGHTAVDPADGSAAGLAGDAAQLLLLPFTFVVQFVDRL